MENVVSFWRDKRVLLTGHTGFKGSWLKLWLEKMGAVVYGYSLPSLDVRDRFQVQLAMSSARPDVVFHLAAQALVRKSYAEPVETYATNVLGTVNVLEAIRMTPGVLSTVIVTSDKCYEANGLPHREGDRLGGADPYSSSKACSELVTQAYMDSFGLRVATARAGNVIGGGDWSGDRLIADAMRAILDGNPVRVRNPDAVRPWQHVLDPLNGYLMLAERLADDEIFRGAWNFGPDEEYSVRWLMDAFCPGFWVEDRSKQPHEAQVLRLHSAKAKSVLGWKPRWSTQEAVARTRDWYLSERVDKTALSLEQIADYERG